MARFFRWSDLKSDREMATDTTDHNRQRPEPDWDTRTIILATVSAFVLCIAAILTFGERGAPRTQTPPATRPVIDRAVAPYVPWSPDAMVNQEVNEAPLREGPYTLRPDAPMLPSNDAFISLLGDGLTPDRFYISRHSNDNSFQGGDWNPDNVIETSDGVRLDVTPTGNPEKPYALA